MSDVLAGPRDAGGLFALKLATGEQIWHTPAPKLDCNTGRGCTGAQSAPVSVIPGVVFSGSVDGHMRAYSTTDGTVIWDFNTARELRDRESRAGEGRLDRRGGPGDRRRPARHQLGLRPVARNAGQRPARLFGEVIRMADPTLRVHAVMSEIDRDVHTRLRRHLIKRGGAADYQDEADLRSGPRGARRAPSTSAISTRCCCPNCWTRTSSGSCRPISRCPPIARWSAGSFWRPSGGSCCR